MTPFWLQLVLVVYLILQVWASVFLVCRADNTAGGRAAALVQIVMFSTLVVVLWRVWGL